jgi:hypothetical protein
MSCATLSSLCRQERPSQARPPSRSLCCRQPFCGCSPMLSQAARPAYCGSAQDAPHACHKPHDPTSSSSAYRP